MNTLELDRYDHCEAALKLPGLKQALYDEGAILMDRVLVTLHGEEHLERRRAEMRVFRRDFFKRYEQDVIPGIFAEVMSQRSGETDDLVDLGYRFMVYLALNFAGIDRQDVTADEMSAEEVETLVGMLRMFGVAATLGQAKPGRDRDEATAAVRKTLAEFDRRFFSPSVHRRQALIEAVRAGDQPESSLPMDVLTVLLKDDDNLQLVRDMMLRETAFYFLAGAHTSVHSLSHALHHVLTWCDASNERQALVDDPVRVQRFVHESFRLHPSSPVSKRRAVEHVELPDGREASPGDIVIINLREANRDVSVFGEDAAVFNPERELAPGVSETGITFGIGMHACLGKNLAAGTLPVPGKPLNLDTHQFGTVAWLTHALLARGIAQDPARTPELDQAIARETWLNYPVVINA